MRIKYSLLPKLRNLTNREMDFLLFIARYQDRSGLVVGVHNQAVCRATGMCKQSFYTVMRVLEAKGLIFCEKKENDYDIRILGNDFSYDGSFNEGYIDLSRKVFHQVRFRKLKSNEKYMLFELLKRTHENRSSFQIYTHNFYKKFMEMLGVTKRVVRYYLHSMRKFFSVGIKDGKYYITYLHSVFHDKDEQIDMIDYGYYVKTQCRRHKIRFDRESLYDTAELIQQYRNHWFDGDKSCQALRSALAGAIEKSVERQKPAERTLQPKYIHKLLRKDLFG